MVGTGYRCALGTFAFVVVNVGLKKGVTDSGIGALVSAGCGGQLISLSLRSE